ncbi:single-stranded DNA-binding protein [Streptosporangium sp. NPDC023615]|uniref:single-stranded DNA-binding protein n=1 Tax=Streptosporangium sp. NPDC023615 TaxID=3154794 RepID=UPI0034430D5E
MNDIHVTLTGNVAAPPRQHTFPDGSRVTSLKIASTSRYFDRENQQWRNGETTYFGVRCFRGLADNVAQSVQMGQPVLVQGRLRIREFTHEGERRFMPEVEAGSLGHDLRWGLGSFSKPQRGGPVPALGSAERSELDRETSDWAMSGGVPALTDALTAAGSGADGGPPRDPRPDGGPGEKFGLDGGTGGFDGRTAGEFGAGGGASEESEAGGVTSGHPGVGGVPGVEPTVVGETAVEGVGITPHVAGHEVPDEDRAHGEGPGRRRRAAAKGAPRRAGAVVVGGRVPAGEAAATEPDEGRVRSGADDEVPWPVREHVAA